MNKILYNPTYRNSLYGAGLFPFWLYVKYFGKPVYKKARKLKLNKYFSLMLANVLGSLVHVGFFINGELINIPFFILSLLLFGGIFYAANKKK